MEETLRRQAHRSSLAAMVSITEGDEAAVVLEDALGTEGGAIQVSGEVLQGRLAPADRSTSATQFIDQIEWGIWTNKCG